MLTGARERFIPIPEGEGGALATLAHMAGLIRQPDPLVDDFTDKMSVLDAEGVERAALINYVAPEVMGFTGTANDWVSAYTRNHRDRLAPVGSVNPRHATDPRAEARRLFEVLGIRMLKIHPPHQLFAANAYVSGDEGLAAVLELRRALK